MAAVGSSCGLTSLRCVASAQRNQPSNASAQRTIFGKKSFGQAIASSKVTHVTEGRRVLRVGAQGVTSEAEAPVELRQVQVESEIGQTYETLQQLLAKGEWEKADHETRKLICILAGDAAKKRKWVYFTEAQFMPTKDLLTIDRLWRAYSDDRFGYSVQRRIWKAQSRQWKPFFLKIQWIHGENSAYKKFPMEFSWQGDAPTGHLPLTNCLRGTQLLEAILTHPAFDSFDGEQVMPDDSKLPDFSNVSSEEPSSESTSPANCTPRGLTGSGFDEDFNSSEFGF